MQDLFRLMARSARRLGATTFCQSMMKQVFLVFMMVSLSRADAWDNNATLSAVCDSSTMNLAVNFTTAFRGIVYQSRNYFNPKCSYMVPFNTNVTEVELSLQYQTCSIRIEELDNRTVASTEVVIQMHTLLDSVYDKVVNVSCEIDSFYPANETEDEEYNPFAASGLERTWIEFKNGLVLFGEVGEPTESSLFLVVKVEEDRSNQDMVVQNCIAHSDVNLTDTTTLVQLSNYYGCPDPSAVLSNFSVFHPESGRATMLAYAPLTNFSLIASRGRMSITCGVTLCENACPAHCNDTESPVRLPLSDYASKIIVARGDGAVMPESLRELNRLNDRSRRAPNRARRSLGSYLSSFFSWVSEGNVTNGTSTGMAKRLFMNITMTDMDSNCPEDRFCMDWQTFRFIALMTICLFITYVACYCCYADQSKTKKGSHPFVF